MKEKKFCPPARRGLLTGRALLSLLLALALAGLCPPATHAQRGRDARVRRAKKASPRTTRPAASRRAAAAKRAPRAVAAGGRYAEGVEPFDADDAEGRGRWFHFKRAYPSGRIPADARRRAWESRPGKGRPLEFAAGMPLWTPVGPAPTTARFPENWGPTSGRVNAVAVSPANPQVVILGAATGGLWRSTDGGNNFAPVSDDQVDLAVGSIAFSPSNPSVVYAGMGDLDNSYVGTGVLRSDDGGLTWARASNATLPQQGFVQDVAVSPSNPQRVYAAQDMSLDASLGAVSPSGFYLSADGGVNWSRKLGGRARSIAVHPTNPSVLYVTMASVDGVGQPGVFKSTNGGESWERIHTPTFGSFTRDIRVALSAADPERIYVLSGARSPVAALRVEVSTNGGLNWTTLGPAPFNVIDPAQFGYNTYLHVSPASASTVFVGARDIYKSTDGGQTWTNVTKNFHRNVNPLNGAVSFPYNPTLSNTHPDQQSLAFSPSNPSVVYAGNDGGLSRSTDGGQTFGSLNASLSLTQFVHLSLHPTDPARSYGGTQDNGTQRRVPGSNTWVEFNEGDGGRSVINPLDPSMVFSTYIFGRVHRNAEHGLAPRVTIASEDSFGEGFGSPRMAFYPPFTGNGVDQRLYFGTWRLFICTDCDTRSLTTVPDPDWTAPAGTLDLTRGGGDVLTSIGVARSNPDFIYTGSLQGRVMASQNGGVSWTDASAGIPNRVVESIVADPTNPSLAYLSVSGYGSGHVFKTTNGGATWADVSGNLPNVPVNALLVDPLNRNIIYAGSDIGVFRSTAGGTAWETFNDGMPPVVVTAFASQASGRIQAATYGRGAYEFAGGAFEPPSASFASLTVAGAEAAGRARLTVNRTSAAGAASVDYATSDGTATERGDYTTARGTLSFAPGETSKTLDVLVSNDRFQEPAETFNVTLSNPSNVALAPAGRVAAVTITSDDTSPGLSPVKWEAFDSAFFVRQHYLDFLSREPDAAGLNHWKNQIDECGANAACLEARRINVSASFFLAIEFQETGYLVYKTHKAAFGDLAGKPVPVTFLTMLSESRQLGEGVEVGIGDWFNKLEANKRAYFDRLAVSPAFLARYPSSLDPGPYVAALNANAGGPLSQAEHDQLANDLVAGNKTRAQVLRAVAEDADLHAAQLNRAFVLMQYFGYLRRDPDAVGFDGQPDPTFEGFHFWLRKLNDNGGNFVNAEMVKSFIISIEYGQRFGH
jgi:photosystem II stability/assembly factor-like uncharacterized protein